jgi:hypothetical protein
MFDHLNTHLQKISAHHVGNKTMGHELLLSKSPIPVDDNRLTELLLKYFLHHFNVPEFYSFTFSNDDFKLNPVFNFASKIFENQKTFHKTSIDIAKHLYELSVHPQIKSGDLFVVYFSKINYIDEITDAIGIFKSENLQSFLKIENAEEEFALSYDDGINIDKLDKGCIIFNTAENQGYRVCIVDKSNKATEAQFWKENFLQLKDCNDDYHHTKEFLNITRNYVTQQMEEDFDVSKADKIDLLNRSVEYFKLHDTFEKEDFEKEVLQDKDIIKSFRNFDETYREDNNLDIEDNFEISNSAVKKQARIFKSVLKLDKNFHIYIHGNRDLIEKGEDTDGRKYYKLYFENEG